MDMICIVCPNGCHITANKTDGGVEISGNACRRGYDFAASELSCPMRSVTTTVKTTSCRMRALPVRTLGEIKKEQMIPFVRALSRVVASPPIKRGDVVADNLLGEGISAVATADLEEG